MVGGVTKRSLTAAAKRRARLEAELAAVSADLGAIDRHREDLVRRRDVAIDGLRELGVSWSALARATGLSRQALMKRAPVDPSTNLDEPLPGL